MKCEHGASVESYRQGKNQSALKITCHSATLSTKIKHGMTYQTWASAVTC